MLERKETLDFLSNGRGRWISCTIGQLNGTVTAPNPKEDIVFEEDVDYSELNRKLNELYANIPSDRVPKYENDTDIVTVFLDNQDKPQIVVLGQNTENESHIKAVVGSKEDGFPLLQYEDLTVKFLEENMESLKRENCSNNIEEWLALQMWNRRMGEVAREIERDVYDLNDLNHIQEMSELIYGGIGENYVPFDLYNGMPCSNKERLKGFLPKNYKEILAAVKLETNQASKEPLKAPNGVKEETGVGGVPTIKPKNLCEAGLHNEESLNFGPYFQPGGPLNLVDKIQKTQEEKREEQGKK